MRIRVVNRSNSATQHITLTISMSDADDFLTSWVLENVNARLYDDTHTAERLAAECLREAKRENLSEADVISAAGGGLAAFMLTELNRAVDDRVARDKS